ncbi:DUF1801 domain-containing protein [Deinococcus sp.]|uniref:iron chaperone n=1 Tax=Deinococcus sp. TaxID=47478 RepID=UPI003B5AABEE
MSAKTTKQPAKSAKPTNAVDQPSGGFTDDERAAAKEHAGELKAQTQRSSPAASMDGESAVLAKLAEMPPPDRALGERLHAIVKTSAPALVPKLWYGMPAYARDGKVVCFFQRAQKFKTRYATLGFSDQAQLDEGAMWPTTFALTALTPVDEARISTLLKRAVN